MNESRVLEARLRCSARGGQRSRAARALAAGRREQGSIWKSVCEQTFRDLRPAERRLRPARARILKMFRPDRAARTAALVGWDQALASGAEN